VRCRPRVSRLVIHTDDEDERIATEAWRADGGMAKLDPYPSNTRQPTLTGRRILVMPCAFGAVAVSARSVA
jgi:hypothetical protein